MKKKDRFKPVIVGFLKYLMSFTGEEFDPYETVTYEVIEISPEEKLRLANEIHPTLESKVQSLLDYKDFEFFKISHGDEFLSTLRKLWFLEKDILQAQSLLSMDIKLGINKQTASGGQITEYITARTPFYRPEYARGDIAVYLGKTEEFGDDLERLKKDKKFMADAKEILQNVMVKHMNMDMDLHMDVEIND